MRKQSPETLRSAGNEECVVLFLASGQKTEIGEDIQEAYRKWQEFTPLQREEMNENMFAGLDNVGVCLYRALTRGFEIWDQAQNRNGAPGWSVTESSLLQVVKQMELNFTSLLQTMDIIWTTVNKNNLDLADNIANLEDENERKNTRLDSRNSIENLKSMLNDQESSPVLSKRKRKVSVTDLHKVTDVLYSQVTDAAIFSANGDSMIKSILDNSPVDDKNWTEGQDHLASPGNPFRDCIEDLIKEDIFRNLRIDECQVDSDFEKQVSPLLSEDEDLI